MKQPDVAERGVPLSLKERIAGEFERFVTKDLDRLETEIVGIDKEKLLVVSHERDVTHSQYTSRVYFAFHLDKEDEFHFRLVAVASVLKNGISFLKWGRPVSAEWSPPEKEFLEVSKNERSGIRSLHYGLENIKGELFPFEQAAFKSMMGKVLKGEIPPQETKTDQEEHREWLGKGRIWVDYENNQLVNLVIRHRDARKDGTWLLHQHSGRPGVVSEHFSNLAEFVEFAKGNQSVKGKGGVMFDVSYDEDGEIFKITIHNKEGKPEYNLTVPKSVEEKNLGRDCVG